MENTGRKSNKFLTDSGSGAAEYGGGTGERNGLGYKQKRKQIGRGGAGIKIKPCINVFNTNIRLKMVKNLTNKNYKLIISKN